MNYKASDQRMRFHWLISPWAILAGMTAGIVTGIFYKKTAVFLAPFGTVYLALLQMSVLPIMICAVVSSIAGLLRSKTASRYIARVAVVFLCGMVLSAGVGIGVGIWGRRAENNLNQRSRDALGKMLSASETGSRSPDLLEAAPESYLSVTDPLKKIEESHQFQNFLLGIVPTNIFSALSKGENLGILFFSILLGIALATVDMKQTDQIIQEIYIVFKAFENIIGWMMYFLPFGLFCLLAGQVAQTGLSMIMALVQDVGMVYAAAFIMVLLNGLVIKFAGRVSFVSTFLALREPLMISFGTRNSFVAMPSAIHALAEELNLEKETANLVIPLGITLCRFGTVMVFGLSTVFFAHLYNVSLGIGSYGMVLCGTVLAALASAGAPGAATVGMLSIVFNPLGLPVDVAIALMLAVDPLTDPVLTMVNVHTNCACTALIARRQSTETAQDSGTAILETLNFLPK